ncbi:hypothetical protein ACWEOW_02230 [Monashia sp. NPDC004114]
MPTSGCPGHIAGQVDRDLTRDEACPRGGRWARRRVEVIAVVEAVHVVSSLTPR